MCHPAGGVNPELAIFWGVVTVTLPAGVLPALLAYAAWREPDERPYAGAADVAALLAAAYGVRLLRAAAGPAEARFQPVRYSAASTFPSSPPSRVRRGSSPSAASAGARVVGIASAVLAFAASVAFAFDWAPPKPDYCPPGAV